MMRWNVLVLSTLAVSFSGAQAEEAGRKQGWLTPSVSSGDPLTLEEEKDAPLLPAVPLEEIRTPISQATYRLRLKAIALEGNTVLPRSAVQEVVQGYLNRPLTDADLHALREALSRLYVAAGYLNSGVVIPDQEVTDATLRLQAVEGSLSSVSIGGDERLSGGYLADRVFAGVPAPLNVYELRDTMRILLRDVNVSGLNAHILPGSTRGEAELRLEVEAAPPAMLFISADNHRSEAIGAEQLHVGFAHTNLTGRGDRLHVGVGVSEGADTGSIAYRFPIRANDTAVRAYYQRDAVDVIERPFDDLDIDTKTDAYGLSLSVPLQESLTQTFSVSIGAEVKESVSKFGGLRFSLSPGAVNGESRVAALVLGTDWVRRTPDQVLAIRGTVRRGIDALDATKAEPTLFDPSETDAEFWSFLGQAQYLRRLGDTLQLAVRSTLQLSDDPLLGIEKLAVGGVNTVRGYRENLLVRDNGWAASLELQWRPFLESESASLRSLAFVPFADYGRAWDNEDVDTTSVTRDTSDAVYIASLGVGLRWQPIEALDFALYWAEDVSDGFGRGDDPRQSNRDRGLQDDGLHFSLSYRYRF